MRNSNRTTRSDSDSVLVGHRLAHLISHLVREHRWNEWELTELDAIENLHAELHEQLECDHPFALLDQTP